MNASEPARKGKGAPPLSPRQCTDAGLALVLLALLAGLLGKQPWALPAAALLTVLLMAAPSLFRPWARLWFGFSHVLGGIMSKVLLTAVFFLVLAPVGLARRWAGKDPMRVKDWKAGTGSVFRDRSHPVSAADLEQPF
jgi:hypothetical protein